MHDSYVPYHLSLPSFKHYVHAFADAFLAVAGRARLDNAEGVLLVVKGWLGRGREDLPLVTSPLWVVNAVDPLQKGSASL